MYLEPLTKLGEMANADDAASQGKQRDMNVDAPLKASAQLAKGSQPCVRALDHPAMTPESVIALDAAPGNTRRDAQLAQVGAATRKVIALVGMQLVRPPARPAALSSHQWQGIDQLLEDHRIVPIGTGDAEHQRDALAVRDDVALAAKLAPVRWVGAGVLAPRGLATLAPSMQARLKSSLPAPRNSSSSSRCRRCHTPAACQSRRRRQHVMPLPKPSSWGSSSQGMPVRKTNKMPFRAISSLTRGRPALGRWHEHWQHRLDLLEQRCTDFFVPALTHAASNADHALGDDRVVLAALKRRRARGWRRAAARPC